MISLERTKPTMKVKIVPLNLALSLLFVLIPLGRCEIPRDQVDQLPCSCLVYDFITALKKRHSMVSSKLLFPFMAASKNVQKIEADKNAWVETVLVEEILAISEEVGDEIVTAVVRTDENQIEVWTFRCELKEGKALLVPSKPRDSALPRLTPWIIRMENLGDTIQTK